MPTRPEGPLRQVAPTLSTSTASARPRRCMEKDNPRPPEGQLQVAPPISITGARHWRLPRLTDQSLHRVCR